MANKPATKAYPNRTQTIEGYRIQPMLPICMPYLGMEILEAEFRRYPSEPDTWYVEALAKIGTVLNPYTIVLSVAQALGADVVERI